MTSCRVDRIALGALFGVALVSVAPFQGVWAQSKPTPLTPAPGARPAPITAQPIEPQYAPAPIPLPSYTRPAQTAPVQAAPGQAAPGQAAPAQGQPFSTETAKPGEASVAPVAAGELAPVSAESLGALSEANGGFGVNLWAKTRRDVVEALLPRLPASVSAPSLQWMARRLLLSVAPPPEGDKRERGLMSVRVERSLARGDLQGAVDLVRMTPAREIDAAMAEARANALLVAGDANGACQEARLRLGKAPGVFWDKLTVFCDLLAKDAPRAQLGVSMVRDQGDRDQAFFTLADALAGNQRAKVTSLPDATALTIAMMRAANQPLPADTGPRGDPLILRAIAQSANAAPALRLEAAHKAALYGALPAEELAKLFEQAEFAPAQLASAFSEAPRLGGMQARALLYRAAKGAADPQARVEALRALYNLGRQEGDFALLARTSLPLLLELKPARAQAWFAADAGRALYSARKLAEAKAWFDLATSEAAHDRDAASAAAALWPLARLADGDNAAPWSGEKMSEWRRGTEASKAENAGVRVAMGLMMFDAFGEPIIGEDFRALHKGPLAQATTVPSALVWFGLREASNDKRIGQTVLQALVGLGEMDLGKQSPVVVGQVVGALKAAGLETEARALAVDAAIAAGM